MHIKFTLSHRTRLPASVIATSLPLYFITDLQLAHKETTYWPKYTIKCVGFSIRLPYTTKTINLAKPLGNYGVGWCMFVLAGARMFHVYARGRCALTSTRAVCSCRNVQGHDRRLELVQGLPNAPQSCNVQRLKHTMQPCVPAA